MSVHMLSEHGMLVNDVYWRDLGVSYDAINELSLSKQEVYLDIIFNSLNLQGLKEISGLNGIVLDKGDTKEKIKKKLSSISREKQHLLLLINDFQNRKKKTIASYYNKIFPNKEYTTTFAQLFVLFKQSSNHLFSILTYHYWTTRGSGNIFAFNKSIAAKKARKVITEKGFKDKLCDLLYKASKEKNVYKIFSYAVIDEYRFIGLLYKQIKDTSIPDYHQAVRNKGIDVLLFGLDTQSNTVEIKTKVNFENIVFKEYMEETFDAVLASREKEVFQNYNKDIILKTMLGEQTASGNPVNDFLVEGIVFRSSPIKNSPEVKLHTEHMDVWPSVSDAHSKGAVNAESLKDIQSFTFKSMDVSRTIRSIIKDNGNVVFTMDDSRLENCTLESIKDKFFQKFGIPLYQEVINHKFPDGKVDLIDYVMAQPNNIKIQETEMVEVYQELIEEKLFLESKVTYANCTDPECPYKDQIVESDLTTNDCPLCYGAIDVKVDRLVHVDLNNIRKEVKKKLKIWCSDSDWIMHRNSTINYGGEQLDLIKVEREYDGKILQFLVVDNSVDKKLLNKLHKMMTPLITVFVAQQDKFIEQYSNECIQAITFGKLYTQSNDDVKSLIENIHENLELRAKNYVASAANKSYHSILEIVGEPAKIDKQKYTFGDLEDDGFALIKDMFPNSVKWGKEQSGKVLPEGVFSLSYLKHGKMKESYAFSFDFKLAYQNNGYPLNINERRKAIHYVNDINDSDLINSFTKLRELTGHIFISNRFNDAQMNTTIEYFYENLIGDVGTKPIFITTDVLAYLHNKYRENFEEIELSKNYYLDWIFKMLVNESNVVTVEQIDQVFSRLLSKDYREIDRMNMPNLTRELTGEYNV